MLPLSFAHPAATNQSQKKKCRGEGDNDDGCTKPPDQQKAELKDRKRKQLTDKTE
jgi:hypothetical protein